MAKIMKDGKPSTSFSRKDREWVKSIRGGDTPTGTITITENGEYDVTNYATADVQVAGGSSDFSTAEVTITLSGSVHSATGLAPVAYNAEDPQEMSFADSTFEITDSPTTLYVILYKGNGAIAFNDPTNTYTISGDIEGEAGEYIVTGNATITIS